jgi:hypothetical protein
MHLGEKPLDDHAAVDDEVYHWLAGPILAHEVRAVRHLAVANGQLIAQRSYLRKHILI